MVCAIQAAKLQLFFGICKYFEEKINFSFILRMVRELGDVFCALDLPKYLQAYHYACKPCYYDNLTNANIDYPKGMEGPGVKTMEVL